MLCFCYDDFQIALHVLINRTESNWCINKYNSYANLWLLFCSKQFPSLMECTWATLATCGHPRSLWQTLVAQKKQKTKTGCWTKSRLLLCSNQLLTYTEVVMCIFFLLISNRLFIQHHRKLPYMKWSLQVTESITVYFKTDPSGSWGSFSRPPTRLAGDAGIAFKRSKAALFHHWVMGSPEAFCVCVTICKPTH